MTDTELNPEGQVRPACRRIEKDAGGYRACGRDIQLVQWGAPVSPSEQLHGLSWEDPGFLHRECGGVQASLRGESQGLALSLCAHANTRFHLRWMFMAVADELQLSQATFCGHHSDLLFQLSSLGLWMREWMEIRGCEDLWELLRHPAPRPGELGFGGDWRGKGRERPKEDFPLLGPDFPTQVLEDQRI